MINGSMMEAHQGLATLEDVDLSTFLRFVQWLYHGYYAAASPRSVAASETDESVQLGQAHFNQDRGDFVDTTNDRSLETEPDPIQVIYTEVAEAEEPIEDVKWGLFGRHHPQYEKFKKSSVQHSNSEVSSFKESFIRRVYTVRNIKKDAPQPRSNSNSQEEYSEVFLGHARLYVFADKYDIQILKILAMEELHAALAVYTLYQERTGDIVALLRYVYANTAESKNGVEDLRTILTQYMEAEIGTLIEDEELQEVMLQDGGPLLADFVKVIRKKLD